MSISNLEVSDTERTILDDWESLLYLICVLATTGIIRQRKNAEIAGLDILGWFNGSAAKVANTKRGHMHSADNFCNHITEHFYDDGDDGSTLADLAEELRECLFNNKQLQSVKCRQGAYKYTDKCTKQRVDPLKPRAKYADVIGDQLLAILERFASENSA
ncbi:hypothetical protein GGF46_005557 [Coemansia sp. RSA 552]|nr:hypothetical protein GGF46_005557 [Coemansia sp. RSA 552]